MNGSQTTTQRTLDSNREFAEHLIVGLIQGVETCPWFYTLSR